MSFVNTFFVLCLTAIILFIILIYIKMKTTLNYWQKRGVKHLKGKFFVGNMALIDTMNFAERIQVLYKNFPDEKYFGFYQFMIPTLMIKDPDLIKQITIKKFDHYVDHQDFADPDVDPYWSRTLFAASGQKWRDLRITLSPSFTATKMKLMFSLVEECCLNFVKFFDDQNKDVIELEMKDTFSRFANDVIASTSFGVTCDSLRNPNNDFYRMGKEVTDFAGSKTLIFFIYMISPALSRLLGIKVISEKVGDYFSKIIKETIAEREKKNIVRPDMLQILMEAMKGNEKHDEELNQDEHFSDLAKDTKKRDITMDDIISQAMMFFFAGFDTVSTFLMYFFYEIAINPEVQNTLRDEILEMNEDVEGTITYPKLTSMKYLEMVASETLRLWPPAILTSRKVTKPTTLEAPGMDPLPLEKGTVCWIPTIGVQRDPKYFLEPTRFNPERFSDPNLSKINQGAYTPFGIGPRTCIGNRFALLESKLLVYHILQHYEIVPTKKTMVPLILDPHDINMHPKGGMWLGFKRIKKTY